jgi:type II secretion system protein G
VVLKFAEMIRSLRREDRGFTLIELLVVIAILGVLAAIALPLVAQRIEEARQSANEANLRLLQGAVELYKLDTNVYPTGAAAGAQSTDEKPYQVWQDLLIAATGVPGYQGPYLKSPVIAPTGHTIYEILTSGIVQNAPAGP